MRYRWEIKTSDTWYSGTDANVFLSLSGSTATMREVQISDPDSINDWEKGDINHGLIETADLGELETGTLRHDQSGPSSGWSVDWVKITREKDGREWTAKVGQFDEGGRFPPLRFVRTQEGQREPEPAQRPASPPQATPPLAEQVALFLKDKGWGPEDVELMLQGPKKGEITTASAAPKPGRPIHHFVTLRGKMKARLEEGEEEDVNPDGPGAEAPPGAPAQMLKHHFVVLKKRNN